MNASPISDITKADLDTVLEQSRPRRNQSMLAPLFLLAILFATLLSVPGDGVWVQMLVPAAMALLIVLSLRYASRMARQQRDEAEGLRVIDESIRLGRWDQAAAMLTRLFASPSARPHVRIQGLIYLGTLFNRIGRFADVIRLYDSLVERVQFPRQISLSLKCMRAYAMLRDNLLSDAYEAIAELRREAPQSSGMVTVLEIYRLVKTGHNDDALALFDERRTQLAQQLSHRSADGWALAAAASLALSRTDQARSYARNACLLSDPSQIALRLPECAPALQLVTPNAGVSA